MNSLRWRIKYSRHTLGVWGTKLLMAFTWRLPRKLVYFAVIRVWAHGTTGDYGGTVPSELGWDEALKRWNRA